MLVKASLCRQTVRFWWQVIATMAVMMTLP
jgi:hypothetical protein